MKLSVHFNNISLISSKNKKYFSAEQIATHFMFSNFFPENRAVYEMRKNMVHPDGPQMII